MATNLSIRLSEALQIQHWRSAEQYVRRLLKESPADGNLHGVLAFVQLNMGKTSEAKTSFDRALRIKPNLEAFTNYMALLINTGDSQRAREVFNQGIKLYTSTEDIQAIELRLHILEGHDREIRTALQGIESPQRSNLISAQIDALVYLADYKAAIRTHMRHSETITKLPSGTKLNLARAYMQGGDFLTAKQHLDELGAEGVKDPIAEDLRAQILVREGELTRALRHYDEVAKLLKAEDPLIYFNRALLNIRLGNWEVGWRDYRYRWESPSFKSPRRYQALPAWKGEPVNQLIIWGEQGLGDQLYFSQLLEFFRSRQTKVTFETDPRLVNLMKQRYLWLDVIPYGPINEAIGPYDAQCALADLAAHFWKNPEMSAPMTPYSHERREVGQVDRQAVMRCVGVSWASTAANAAERNISLGRILELIPSSWTVVSLQYGKPKDEIGNQAREVKKLDLDVDNDLDGLVREMARLDAVITIGNTIAHLAGWSNLPTLVILPSTAREIWMTDLRLSRYPSVTIERMPIGKITNQWNGAGLAALFK